MSVCQIGETSASSDWRIKGLRVAQRQLGVIRRCPGQAGSPLQCVKWEFNANYEAR
jgi:hypothetical protein